jgi:hypothetical protein
MVNPNEDYEQDKIKGNAKQTIIIDERETGETDELDPKFSDPDTSPTDPEKTPENNALDGEGIDESRMGLNSQDHEIEDNHNFEDPGLNRDTDDDLSLNKPQNDLF